MAQSIRQSELFSGEDWQVLYRAFTDINFNSYDFDTIRASMIEYIRFNFPEDFNDWIESSEFVALIDLISYLGQILAFRMDLNTRENFIDAAERRDSVLKLARLLSYTPSRNIASEGLVKIEALETNEPIIDSSGQNLQNVFIEWNDANNPDWYEQWTLILNSAFISTNPFGKSVKAGTVNGIPTHLYQMSNNPVSAGSYPFSAVVKNQSLQFEVVNTDFVDQERFIERDPDALYSMHMIYRNDGLGNQSPNTGFFFHFKQGSTSFEDFNISVPLENRVIDLNINQINNSDVWVQTVSDSGFTLINWTKVPAVFGNNVIYNSLTENERNIFSVITREQDQVSIRFADGVFGNVPTGIIRVYYRVSANSTYTIKTSDIQRKVIRIPYFNTRGDLYTLTATFSLKEAVANSVESETIDQIKNRAPLVYYSQNRMVNGEDYNVFPLQSTNILKLKSVNRVYSGHSRFIDINDPTGLFQSVNVFASDGAIYQEYNNNYIEIPLSANKTSGEIVSTSLFEILKNPDLQQFVYREYPIEVAELFPENNPFYPGDVPVVWEQASNASFSSTGIFDVPVGATSPATTLADFITEGALIQFENAGWVKVHSILNTGTAFQLNGAGAVTLTEPVLSGDPIVKIYPAFRTTLVASEITQIRTEIDDQNTFGLRFDHTTQSWVVIKSANLESTKQPPFSLEFAGDATLTSLDTSWLVRFDFKTDHWEITSKGLRYVYESEQNVRFFVNQFYKVAGITTSRSSRDTITVFGINTKPSSKSIGLGEDLVFRSLDVFTYEDGHTEPRRLLITYEDADDDGVPDDPDIFTKVVLNAVDANGDPVTLPDVEKYVFHKKTVDQFGYENFELDGTIVAVPKLDAEDETSLQYTDEDGNVINIAPLIQEGTVVFDVAASNETSGEPILFLSYKGTGDRFDPASYDALDPTNYQYHIGRSGLHFLWKHIATKDQRIDPAITNIVDNLVLTTGYDADFRLWIASSGSAADMPATPTSEQLDVTFSSFDEYKMVSDEIIWRSAKYKPLFGEKASEELRARIKVVKVPTTDVNDNEIKSRVINIINDYFAVQNWDFGETFFASELAAYVHQQLPTIVGGFNIVPLNEEAKFGNLQQIKANTDEIFISVATVSDVEIVPVFTESSLRIGR